MNIEVFANWVGMSVIWTAGIALTMVLIGFFLVSPVVALVWWFGWMKKSLWKFKLIRYSLDDIDDLALTEAWQRVYSAIRHDKVKTGEEVLRAFLNGYKGSVR